MKPEAFPTSTAAAVVRNRDQLRSITEAWLAAFPTNPDAIEAHARALESLGELRDDRPPVRSALLLYRDGRSVAADADQRTRLELGQLRVLLKLGRFEAARALADSLLTDAIARQSHLRGGAGRCRRSDWTPKPGRIAAGTGCEHRRSAVPDGTPIAVTPALRETWLELLAYASVGAPEDSLTGLEGRMQGQVKSYIAPRPTGRKSTHVLLHQVHRPRIHMRWEPPPVIGPRRSRIRSSVCNGWRCTGDKAGVRRQMDEVGRLRRSGTPGTSLWTRHSARLGSDYPSETPPPPPVSSIRCSTHCRRSESPLLGDVPQGSIPQAAACLRCWRCEPSSRPTPETVRWRAPERRRLWRSGAAPNPPLASQVSRLRDLAAGR